MKTQGWDPLSRSPSIRRTLANQGKADTGDSFRKSLRLAPMRLRISRRLLLNVLHGSSTCSRFPQPPRSFCEPSTTSTEPPAEQRNFYKVRERCRNSFTYALGNSEHDSLVFTGQNSIYLFIYLLGKKLETNWRAESEKDLQLKMSRPTESEIRSAPDSIATKINTQFLFNFNFREAACDVRDLWLGGKRAKTQWRTALMMIFFFYRANELMISPNMFLLRYSNGNIFNSRYICKFFPQFLDVESVRV